VNLGRDLADAITRYASLIGTAWSGRTLGDVIDRYRVQVLPTKRSAQTRADEGKALDRLKRVYGHMLPDGLSAPMLYRYLDERKTPEGMPAPVAARHEIALLGHIYGKAIRWGIASSNPVRGLDYGERGGKRRKVELAEVQRLCELASERMRVAIDLAVSTGQRRGDLLSLKRDQLTDDGIVFQQSKTGSGVLIAWSDDLRAIVARANALSPQIPADYLIRKPNGKRYTARGFSAIWQRLMAKALKCGKNGEPPALTERFTFHDLRSVSADGAQTAEEARDRLGHASVETTKRHYLRGLTKAKPRS
jgi:integrase